MTKEREKVRCGGCELVQWRVGANCRRCGSSLPQPIVKIVERIVERVVIRQDPQSLKNLEHALQLIVAASGLLAQQRIESTVPLVIADPTQSGSFPTMAEMERTMILAAYRRSNRKPIEAARLLGIGKTTLYRKLRGISHMAS